MPLDWFGRSKRASVADLIARKNYKKAIEAIKAELEKRGKDRRLRLQLVDVLVLAGRPKEAAKILDVLADDLVLAGFGAQAIAVLKRIQALDPGRSDVEEKLVYLVDQRSRPAEDPWAMAQRRRAMEPHPQAMPEFGMEEAGDDGPVELGMEEAADAEAGAPAGESSDLFSDDAVRDELVALIEDALTPGPQAQVLEPSAPASRSASPVQDSSSFETPLFKDFTPDELKAVVQGLRLVTYQPGEIVITEGEPRGSLFVITSGVVRAYVRHRSGRSLPIRELKEGDFFGEIAVLTGSARTATITAATRCEMLELDRPTLDSVCLSHPRVREVLKEFHEQRANNTIEAAIRGMELG